MTGEWRSIVEELLKSQIVQFVGYALATAVACVGVYYAWRSYSVSRSALDRNPKLDIVLFRLPIPDRLIYILPFKGNQSFRIPLHIVLSNTGDVSAKNVEISLEIPDEIYNRDGGRLLSSIAEAKGVRYADQQGRTKPNASVFLGAMELVPKSAVDVRLEIHARSATRIDLSGNYPTMDSSEIQLTGHLDLAWPVSASITTTDMPPKNVSFRVSFLSCSDAFLEKARIELEASELYAALGEIAANDDITIVVFKEFEREIFETEDGAHTLLEGKLESIALARLSGSSSASDPAGAS